LAKSAKREISSQDIAKKNSGVYQYVGEKPPLEFLSLFNGKSKSNEEKIKNKVKDNRNNRTSNPKKASQVGKPEKLGRNINDRDDIESLEREVLSKFGSSQYSFEGTDKDDNDYEDIAPKKLRVGALGKENLSKARDDNSGAKFEGFDPIKPKRKLPASAFDMNTPTDRKPLKLGKLFESNTLSKTKSKGDVNSLTTIEDIFSDDNDDDDDDDDDADTEEYDTGKATMAKLFSKKKPMGSKLPSYFTDDFDDYDEQSSSVDGNKISNSRSGPLNAQNGRRINKNICGLSHCQNSYGIGYRLRKPPPISLEESEKKAAIEAAIVLKEEQQKEKRAEKRKKEADSFYPFDFSDKELNGTKETLFSSKAFIDLGVRIFHENI
jgi:hypothetical protein